MSCDEMKVESLVSDTKRKPKLMGFNILWMSEVGEETFFLKVAKLSHESFSS